MAISRDARPKLARKASLRFDRIEQKHILLYPERGLRLNEVGAVITARCDGARTVTEIIAEVTTAFPAAPSAEIEADVIVFLDRLAERGLLEGIC